MRHDFSRLLHGGIIILFLSALVPAAAETATPAKRPNVLFIISDDLSSRIRPTGYEGVLTPVLDRVAAQATTFRRAYCQYPVCGPSRASFLSGLYPQTTGVLDNKLNIAETRPNTLSIPKAFRQAGYWTAATGKVFHKPLENPGNDTWDQVTAFENDETELERAARVKFEESHGPITDGESRRAWKEHLPGIAPQTRNQGVKGVGPGFGPTGLRDEQHSDGKNARQVAAWISGKSNGDQPFFIACGFHKPHIPFLAPDSYFEKYPPDSIRLSRSPANDWDDIPAIAATKQYLNYGFPELGKEDDARRRAYMQAYYACISFIDAQFGLIIDALRESGEWENTIIVFVGDHGYHLGEHHMWGKVLLFEESARMPMIVRVPGMTKGGSANGLVEMVDLFPTLADLCGVKPPANLQGLSLKPLLRDADAPGKEFAYTVVKRGKQLGAAIRFDHWRYTEWGSPRQAELYDLSADPGEFTNLIGDKDHDATLIRAKRLLAKAQRQAKEIAAMPCRRRPMDMNQHEAFRDLILEFRKHPTQTKQKMRRILSTAILSLLTVTPLAAQSAAPDATPFPKPPSIKGLQVQMIDDALALGIHHAGVNINITGLVDLEKRPENPKRTVDGFEFSFHEPYLKLLDSQIKPLSDKGVLVYLIVIAYPSKNEAVDSLVIHPDARKDYKYTVGGFNSKTPEGRAWLKAVSMEMASRWSGARPECGRVWGWIVGNEVNSHWVWSNIGNKPVNDAAAEYAQAFRIIHGSVREASEHARLYISFDHHWGGGMHGISAEEAAPGRDYLDAFAKLNGDLDWHVAWHPYPEDLRNPRAWADPTATSENTSHKVTFKNLEVLCRHLRKPELLFKGEPRRVILSEQGFDTPAQADGEMLQAAAYAYAWEKCKKLPLIDAFIYHRHVDHSHEGGLLLGLWRNVPGSISDPGEKKQIRELFLKAGTPGWDAAAAAYLPVTGLKSWDELTGE